MIKTGQTVLASDLVPQNFFNIHMNTNGGGNGYMDQPAHMTLQGTTFYIETIAKGLQSRDTTNEAASYGPYSLVVLGNYIYACCTNGTNWKVMRYLLSDLTSSPVVMTIAGQAFGTTGGATLMRMTSDGTAFYFTYKGNTSANSYIVSQYTLSGTTLTYVADITCGSTADSLRGFCVDASQNVYGFSSADNKVRKFNSSGTLQYTTAAFNNAPSNNGMLNFQDHFYIEYILTSITGADGGVFYELVYLP